jgi:hypothetical protein
MTSLVYVFLNFSQQCYVVLGNKNLYIFCRFIVECSVHFQTYKQTIHM